MASFVLLGPGTPDAVPASPVVVSVPHAGRDYPASLRAALRVPFPMAETLEDRHVDAVAIAARSVQATLIQRRARAWIDLNRGEAERDPRLEAEGPSRPSLSAKVRSGLGLVPRRTQRAGDLWRERLPAGEVDLRIADDHRPYHAALAALLAASRARFGVAVLLDLHSMPTLPGGAPARVVLGDRFGRSSPPRFVRRLEAEVRGAGLPFALNAPYAGGHILERHARPAAGIHAVQLEIDRHCYLDGDGLPQGAGFDRIVVLIRSMLVALEDEALGSVQPLAAE